MWRYVLCSYGLYGNQEIGKSLKEKYFPLDRLFTMLPVFYLAVSLLIKDDLSHARLCTRDRRESLGADQTQEGTR